MIKGDSVYTYDMLGILQLKFLVQMRNQNSGIIMLGYLV